MVLELSVKPAHDGPVYTLTIHSSTLLYYIIVRVPSPFCEYYVWSRDLGNTPLRIITTIGKKQKYVGIYLYTNSADR